MQTSPNTNSTPHHTTKVPRWSEDEIDFLSKLYLDEGKAVEIIHLFYGELFKNRTLSAIRAKIANLGLSGARPRVDWTEEEDILLTEVYPKFRNGDLTAFFTARSSKAIAARAGKLKLRKNSMVIYANPDARALKKSYGLFDKFDDFLLVVRKRFENWKLLTQAATKPTIH